MTDLLRRLRWSIILALLSGSPLTCQAWGADHTVPNPELVPHVHWTRGCSPTSATMVLGYYDNYVLDSSAIYLGYGRLISNWMDLSHKSDGSGDTENVPNILEHLRLAMGTDVDGNTHIGNIGPAIEGVTNAIGYPFTSEHCVGWGWWEHDAPGYVNNDSCWPAITNEIDHGRPFVWSVRNSGKGHSLAAWGYTDDKYVITYNTWNYGRADWYYIYYNNNGVLNSISDVDSVIPSAPEGDSQIALDTPAGGEWLWGGQVVPFWWYQWGSLITEAELLYSSDGGSTFLPLASRPSVPGWNSFQARVPNIAFSEAVRFMVKGFDAGSNYIAADGTKATAKILVDTWKPVGAGLAINNGSPYTKSTTVNLSLSATDDDSGVAGMCISNSSDPSTCSWEDFAPTKTWTLTGGDGTKYVYAWYKDGGGNATDTPSQAWIILDSTAPTGSLTINNGAATTDSTSVTLALSAVELNGNPQMCLSNTTSCSSWEPFATSKSWTLTAGDGTKTVYLTLKDDAGNQSSAYSDTIVLDTTAPVGSISIENGTGYAKSSSVILALSASGASSMCLRNSTILNCALLWEPFSATKAWTLPGGDGSKTVYALFKDGSGNVSQLYSDSIIVDTAGPTGSVTIAGGAAYTGVASVNLNLAAVDPNGVTRMCLRSSTMFPCAPFWEPYASTKTWKLSGGDGTKTVYAMFMDAAGNASPVYAASITLDTAAPTGSIVINGGATYTRSPSVSLALSAADPSGITKMNIRNEGGGFHFEPYDATKQWTLPAGDGTKTVYAIFMDNALNLSTMYSDTITLDTTPPADGALTATASGGQVSLNWSGFYDLISGIASYTVCASDDSPPPPCSAASLQIYRGAATSYLHTGLTNGAMKFYRVCATDVAGNTSAGATVSAIPAVPYVYVSKDGFCNGHSHCFSGIQNGIAAAGNPFVVNITQEIYDESITFNLDHELTLRGGWNAAYSANPSATIIRGTLTIARGKIIAERIVLR